jgi:hypothetical protein
MEPGGPIYEFRNVTPLSWVNSFPTGYGLVRSPSGGSLQDGAGACDVAFNTP